MPVRDFSAFFSQATGNQPYPYQPRLADEAVRSRLVHVPTGLNEIATVALVAVLDCGVEQDKRITSLPVAVPERPRPSGEPT